MGVNFAPPMMTQNGILANIVTATVKDPDVLGCSAGVIAAIVVTSNMLEMQKTMTGSPMVQPHGYVSIRSWFA